MASKKLLSSLALQLADFRKGEIEVPDEDHVKRWISQFDAKVHDRILEEVIHVFGQTYITRKAVNTFLKTVASHAKLTNGDPKKFWSESSVLKIQQAGSSQKEMLQLLREIVEKAHHVDIEDSPQDSDVAVYIDDGVFGGGHVRGDIVSWVNDGAPDKVAIHIIVLALHSGGEWFAEQKIQEAAKEVGKKVKLVWWRIQQIEDRKAYINDSDVLRPTRIPEHELAQEYADALKNAGYPPTLRKPGSVGKSKFFSSEEGRDLLEQQFLIKGAEIRQQCPYLNDFQRPLGNTLLNTLGFGAMTVTFRNCPNNCPLVLWVGDPWNPLCPRRTN